jgi:drug/metabolite transporter (DMT)-like permease
MILIWAFNYIFGKVALRYMDGFTLASFRLVLAGVLILPVYFAASRITGVHAHFPRRDWPALLALAIFGVVINQGSFTMGLSFTSVGHSSIVVGTVPVVVLLLACSIGQERLNIPRLAGLAVSFGGIVVLTAEHGTHGSGSSLKGDLWTLLGVIGFATYTVSGKKIAARYDAIAMNTFNQCAAGVIILPLAIRQAERLDWTRVPWQGWFGVFYMAVMSSIVGYLIFYWALRYMSASRLAAFSYLQPVMAIALAALLVDEHITLHVVAGGALVLLGVYLTERGLGERTPPPDPV